MNIESIDYEYKDGVLVQPNKRDIACLKLGLENLEFLSLQDNAKEHNDGLDEIHDLVEAIINENLNLHK